VCSSDLIDNGEFCSLYFIGGSMKLDNLRVICDCVDYTISELNDEIVKITEKIKNGELVNDESSSKRIKSLLKAGCIFHVLLGRYNNFFDDSFRVVCKNLNLEAYKGDFIKLEESEDFFTLAQMNYEEGLKMYIQDKKNNIYSGKPEVVKDL
jgi:hypothetical protein